MKTIQRSCLRAGPLFLLLASFASPVLGQTVGASLTGTVTDNTGAVLTRASVAAVHRNTGVEYPTQTNDAGVYTITGLPIGTYVVKAEAPGFKSVTTNPLKLEVGQIARVNLKLEVGAVTEEVQVTGVNPILQTENAVVGEIISGSTVVALPLNGRNYAQLTLLAPGVQSHAPDTFTEVKTNGVSGSGRPYVNGQREQSNNFMLDGIDQNEAVDNLIAYYPSPDAIAEMKVDTNNYSAEYGNVAGGVVNVVTKSGSNEFHGSAFTFARDDKFDANTWTNNRSGAKKGNFSQQIFGGTLGGPLARNKLFFFVDYQGTRINRPGDTVATVAPAEWRNGDFSSLLARGIVITDPLTGLPFPNNQVPTSRFSPAARALLGNTTNYPLPNRPGVNGLTGNYVAFQDSQTRNHQGDLRVDANLSPSDNLSIRGSVGTYRNLFTETVFPLRPGGGWDSDAQSVAVNWAHTWPSAVNELRVGWSHVSIDDNPTANVFGLGDYNQTLGISGGQVIPGLSDISFPNSGIDGVGNAALRHFTNNKTFQISEKVSLSRGRHFLSVGGQFLHYQMGQDYASNSGQLGSFQFNGNFTGFGFSDFLLDQVSQKRIGRSSPWTQLQNRIGVFVQDDLKVRSRLTLNLGLRWEYASPIVEKDDKQVNFDIRTGEARFAGQDGNSRGLYDPYYGGFSPRLGFAWTANDKTVLRGGYGMVQYMEGTGANCRLPLNPPFFGEFLRNYTASPGSLATGFSDVQDLTNVQLRVWQTDLRPQLTQQWNLFVERRVSDTTSLNVGYVGSKSTHVVSFGNFNQPLPGVGDPSTWAPDEQRRPFPQYGLWRYTASDAKMNYHGLQTSLRRRRANGLEFLASYTLSKALTDNVGFYGAGWGGFNADETNGSVGGSGNLNFRDKSLEYGPAWFSSKHTGAFSASYELPIGKGRRVGSDWGGVADALLGGWNVSSILTVRSGLPITVVNGWGNISLQSSSVVLQERPDRIGDGSASSPSWDSWLDASAFRDPALGQFGDSGVGILRGAGFYNIDLGIDKNFDLGASRVLTLRIEAFNVLNHSNKGLPVRDLTDPRFGQILGTANRARVLEFAGKFQFDD